MYVLGKRSNPIGFVAVGDRLRPGLFVRFLHWHFRLKPTRDELFSERNGYTKTYRLAGLSFSVRRIKDPTV